MAEYADLELSLHRRDSDCYAVELRFSRPDSDADMRFEPTEARFDWDALRAHTLDPVAYGQLLTHSLFADPRARGALAEIRAVTQAAHPALGLRLRLLIGPSAPRRRTTAHGCTCCRRRTRPRWQ